MVFISNRLLHLAVTKKYRNREVVKLLLIAGALVDAKDRFNKTVLILVSIRRELIIANYLFLFNTDV